MNILKIIGSLLLVLALSITLLGMYWSSANLDESKHTEVLRYDNSLNREDSSLVVMTYNIGYLSGMINNQPIRREYSFFDDNLQSAKKLLRSLDADIIGFQEIDFASSRSFEINQLDTLAAAGNYLTAYKSVNWDKKYVPFPYWPLSNHFGRMLSGQAILAQYPLDGVHTATLSFLQNAPAYYKAFYLDRLLQMAEIDFLGQKILIMNVHLEAFDQKTRLVQIKTVRKEYEKFALKQPVLLLGDFNSEIPDISTDVDAIQLLMDAPWIKSAILFEHEDRNGTYPSDSPARMIDYIFYNENFLTCQNARVITEAGQVSDHLPVLASFVLDERM